MNFIVIQERSILILLVFSAVVFKCKNNRIVTSTYLLVYSVTIFTILQVFYWYLGYVFVTEFTYHEIKSEVTDMVHSLELIVLEYGLVLIFFNSIWNRNNQEKYLNGIVDLEEATKKLILTFNQVDCHKSIDKTSNILYFSSVVFDGCVFSIQIYLRQHFELLTASFYYMLCAHLINKLVIFLLMVVRMQKNLFQAFNENLTQVLSTSAFNSSDLVKLFRLHKKMVKSIELFKNSFGMVCTALFLYVVGCQTCDMYLGPFNTLTAAITSKSILNAVMNTIWVFPIIFLLSFLAFDCKRTFDESNQMYSILERESNDYENVGKDMVKLQTFHYDHFECKL